MEKHKAIIDEVINHLNQYHDTKGAEVNKVKIDDSMEYFTSYSVTVNMPALFDRWGADSVNKVLNAVYLAMLGERSKVGNFTDREKEFDSDRYFNARFSFHFTLDK